MFRLLVFIHAQTDQIYSQFNTDKSVYNVQFRQTNHCKMDKYNVYDYCLGTRSAKPFECQHIIYLFAGICSQSTLRRLRIQLTARTQSDRCVHTCTSHKRCVRFGMRARALGSTAPVCVWHVM